MMKLYSHGHRGGIRMVEVPNQTEAKLKTAERFFLQRTQMLGNGMIRLAVHLGITFAKEVSK